MVLARPAWTTALWAALAVALAASPAAAEWLPATVELSDGTRTEGRVQITDDALMVQDAAEGRRYTVRAAEIVRLDTVVERQSMEEKYIFPESGRDDKVYTGDRYPVREYLTRITFHDGRQLEGHIVPKTLYLESGGKQQRYVLRHKAEGEVGQKLDDLVYVRSVALKAQGSGTRGTIEAALVAPPGARLQKVLAINRDKLFAVEAPLVPSGRFRATDCTEGTYDLVAVTDRAIYLCFSREHDEGAARLGPEQWAGPQAWIDKLRDFFTTQKIVCAAGNEERLFVLVRQERAGGTTSEEAQHVRRYEVWAMHKPAAEWQIEKRLLVTRTVSDKPLGPAPAIVIVPALGGHAVSAASADVRVDVTLPARKEPAAPGEQPHGR